jgi:hypothetical protein
LVAKSAPESPAATEQLMEEVCDRENLQRAWKRVNAGEKMHQRAGVKLHHGGMPNGPTGRLLLRDKQNEKRIASPAKVPETSSVASPSELPLPQLILRPAPAPLLNPKINAY